MAMAGPRRKEKWGLDPRGTKWANDQNKFGFKMLEKMGWSDGQGLGVNLDGGTDHVRVKTKNNTLGIGASTVDVDYNWLQTQDTFNSLLKDLNQACGTAEGVIPTGPPPATQIQTAPPKRRRGARMAMFEARFRKSKDASIMGDDDMACILGADTRRPERLQDKASETTTPEEVDEEFKTITNKQSMGDYFANLMAKKQGGPSATIEDPPPTPTPAPTALAPTPTEQKKDKKKKKSKKDKRKRGATDTLDDSEDVTTTIEKSDKKNKRKKSSEDEKVEEVTASETETTIAKPSKKSKKSSKREKKAKLAANSTPTPQEETPQETQITVTTTTELNVATDTATKKSKKKKKTSKQKKNKD